MKNDLHIQFILIKKDKNAGYWKRLVEEDKKNTNIQVDWSKYIDEDDEDTEANKGIGGGDWDPEMMNSKNLFNLFIFSFFFWFIS